MLQIDNTVISLDLLEERFVCDLVSCKGACCIEGDSGAPLEDNEIEIIEELMPLIWDDLSDVSKKVIEKQGVCFTSMRTMNRSLPLSAGVNVFLPSPTKTESVNALLKRHTARAKRIFINPFPVIYIP